MMTDDEKALRFKLLQLEQENEQRRRMAEAAGIPPLLKPDRPDAKELGVLYDMVTQTYPQLSCPIAQFERCLMAIAYFRRQAKPNPSYFPMKWSDDAKDWLKRQGHSQDISLPAFTAAAIVSGVVYTPLDRFPYDLEFGFALGGVGKPTNGWRSVLESGRVPSPTALNRPRSYVEQQTIIQPTVPVTDERGGSGTRIR